MKPLVIVSGGFDPLTSGHCEYFEEAAQLGEVICILNNDAWLARKKGKPFMPLRERERIVASNKHISMTWVQGSAVDDVSYEIAAIYQKFKKQYPEIIFFKAGDRNCDKVVPEVGVCNKYKIKVVYGRSDKTVSSSWFLRDWKIEEQCDRPWGKWITLRDFGPIKLKLLEIAPDQKISLQHHKHRHETWFVLSGKGQMFVDGEVFDIAPVQSFTITVGEWHQVKNIGNEVLRIVEVQHGDKCFENDIERDPQDVL